MARRCSLPPADADVVRLTCGDFPRVSGLVVGNANAVAGVVPALGPLPVRLHWG